MLEVLLGVAGLAVGLGLLAISSDRAVGHTVELALALGLSPMITGLLIVSVGTDLPEIANSFLSAALGHADVSIGDSFGSCLTQITLILGILAIVGGNIRFDRDSVLTSGILQALALVIALSISQKGFITRIDAGLLVLTWALAVILLRKTSPGEKGMPTAKATAPKRYLFNSVMAFVSYVGVWIGSFITIESVIVLSPYLGIPEFLVSFFIVGIGTSLPELVVDLSAIRKGQHELAIGDIIGSNLVDATLAVGLGPLFFPVPVTASAALATGLYALIASLAAVGLLVFKGSLDRNAGILLLTVYAFSFVWVPVWMSLLS